MSAVKILAFGSLLLLGGRIADYVGRRMMFVIGLIGVGIASPHVGDFRAVLVCAIVLAALSVVSMAGIRRGPLSP